MPSAHVFSEELRYFRNSADVFARIAHEPWSVFLDSGYPFCDQGRYDILAGEPICTVTARNGATVISRGARMESSVDNPFAALRQALSACSAPAPADRPAPLPFAGGAIGYFGYDLGRCLEKLPVIAEDSENIPDMAVGVYAWAVVVDHDRRRAYLTGQTAFRDQARQWLGRLTAPDAPVERPPFRLLSPIRCNMDRDQYRRAFDRIKFYLEEGDCYQVNLTQRFAADCEGHPWQVYRSLREANPAPFSAYFNAGAAQILSSSPERFLKLSDGRVETKPIKGTCRRKADPDQDREQMEGLRQSPKDRAENLMIVDLLRNDLGKCCRNGSIQVPSLFAVETYRTVHHLVSTVTGELAPGCDALDLLQSCFPGGSITGAPKIRAMAIIEELEPNRRGVYCGAIGYIGFDGNMDTNIAIRTMVHGDGVIRFWAGGGIIYDSDSDGEYQECFDKAGALLRVLQAFSGNDRR